MCKGTSSYITQIFNKIINKLELYTCIYNRSYTIFDYINMYYFLLKIEMYDVEK